MMKKNLMLMVLFLMGLGYCHAQEDVKKDCFYSEKGYMMKKGWIKVGKVKYNYDGLYSTDGKILYKLVGLNTLMAVAPGTEIVAENACLGVGHDFWLLIPKSVKYISKNALPPKVFFDLYDTADVVEEKTENDKN